ncbi:arsenic transporter [Priestia aryabhattai]|uniref:arsenic transporter n=1 Tax=Priestia TaxID=2800373 RepID=UPI0008DE652F|nr:MULTISPECIES: arsenic transporter [Priestia]MBX9969181.1 arsenic transporter [Priestia aryabhattai]MDH3115923.1 arsenic transporter [Priestia aryabhattai]MDH3125186.1 arsenic transporter [Priestia aryabhattai]MDO6850418.1 arsenic transporter [Priestia megaterium]MDY0940019.1 arsenic transporter [Priestia megaterium]
MNIEIGIAIFVFTMTMLVIFWRPNGINEAWPAAIGAAIILLTGIVSKSDIVDIFGKISGASITIIATIVMAVILESFGFFHWAAARLVSLSKGSGYRLYWYIQLLCFLMTLLFNNDGSILITTPILILLLKNLQLKPHQQIPYLLSGALIATASSAPIGVSNIVNLIALKIVHMSLYMHTAMMFVPATLGLLFMSWLMYTVVKRHLPKKLPHASKDIEESFFTKQFHPLKGSISVETKRKRTQFMLKVLLFVFVMRCLLFVASYFGIPIELVAVLGSLILLIWRWYHLRTNPIDILKKTPWHIFVFAFSMYVIIYGLHNVGLTELLVKICEPIVNRGLFEASFIMGGLVSILSNLFNNHPALMVGTITLTEMGLDPITLKTIYLANIIGSDMGSLLLPIGTLASLIWMHILKENHIKVKWKDYLKVSLIVIPLTTIVTLFLLFYWVQLIFS